MRPSDLDCTSQIFGSTLAYPLWSVRVGTYGARARCVTCDLLILVVMGTAGTLAGGPALKVGPCIGPKHVIFIFRCLSENMQQFLGVRTTYPTVHRGACSKVKPCPVPANVARSKAKWQVVKSVAGHSTIEIEALVNGFLAKK